MAESLQGEGPGFEQMNMEGLLQLDSAWVSIWEVWGLQTLLYWLPDGPCPGLGRSYPAAKEWAA